MLKIFELIGRYFILMGKVFSRPEKRAIYRRRIIYEMESLGLNSIGLTAIISVFIGAVITLQMSINLESPFIPKYIIGYATRETMILEFSSTVVALILAGKVGSSIASEIGTMRITEQIDALEIMGVNSASYLILPKIVATVLFFPFLAILSILIGIAGGYLISALTGIMIPDDYVQGLLYDFRPLLDHLHTYQDGRFRLHHHLDFGLLRLLRQGQLARSGGRLDQGGRGQLDRHHDLQLDSHPNPAYMIKADHISKSFDGRVVLDDVSVEFDTGTTNLVIGKSGSGKTVLLKCLVGLHEVDSGSIWYDDIDFTALGFKERKAIRRDIGMLFQGGALLDSSTVEENVKLPLDLFTEQSEKEKMERVNFCLQRVRLNGANHLYPAELSGGMIKRAAIARAIVLNPKYLFCDEPNSGLDPQTSIVIDNLIHEITQEYGITTIINTHDMNSVMEIGEKIVYIHEGRKWWEGTKEEILHARNRELNDFVFASAMAKRAKQMTPDGE